MIGTEKSLIKNRCITNLMFFIYNILKVIKICYYSLTGQMCLIFIVKLLYLNESKTPLIFNIKIKIFFDTHMKLLKKEKTEK